MKRQEVGTKLSGVQLDVSSKKTRRDHILSKLHTNATDLLKAEPSEVNIYTHFVEMGADSLVLIDVISLVEITYGVKINMRQLFEELTTLDALASYIDQSLPPEETPADLQSLNSQPQKQQQQLAQLTTPAISVPSNSEISNSNESVQVAETALTSIMKQQLQVVSQVISQQLEILHRNSSSSRSLLSSQNGQSQPADQVKVSAADSLKKTQQNRVSEKAFASAKRSSLPSKVPLPSTNELNEQQKQYLELFIKNYNQRTQKSKQRAQTYRSVLADSRSVAGFRPSTKELVYPIVGERSRGARLWDIDGNEYVDMTMGFGVLLFGHAPPFITAAREEQSQQGIEIGPQSNYAGEVAQLICELTGMERVAFCNSGTEAVMTALRLARTATGRTKIALFSGSYHGHFDGVLAKALPGQFSATPLAPGISQHAVGDILVLNYGDPKSIDILQAHAHELAAVLVEPVQSRQPDLQPKEFLQKLRQLTATANIALIFDEVLVGFRIHPGGAQAWFGVEADIATYGKIVGGGMPIGVVAGKATYMDGIDGGSWNYGDASYPLAEKTVFAGTFNKNHMGMAVARAVLQHLKDQGPALQQQLNHRTLQFVTTLNTYFEQENVPIRVIHFGSLFRFVFSGNLDLFFYHLLFRGVYIWEGRNCFLSTSHTDEDLDYVIQAVKDSVEALRAGGFLVKPSITKRLENIVQSSIAVNDIQTLRENVSKLQAPPLIPVARNTNLPLSLAQERLWFLNQFESNSPLYNIPAAVRLQGQLKVTALEQSFREIICRHEALRTNFITQDGQLLQIIHPVLSWTMSVIDLQHLSESDREIESQQLATIEAQRPFNLAQEPLVRTTLLKLSNTDHVLLLTMHHIVSDGWSMSIIVKELAALYSAFIKNQPSPLPELPIQYVDFAVWQRQWLQGDILQSQLAYWKQHLDGATTVLSLPTDRPRPAVQTPRGAHQAIAFSNELSKALKLLSRQEGVSLFMTLLAAFNTLLYHYTAQADILVGSPIANRNRSEIKGLIGYFLNILLLRTDMSGNPSFHELLQRVRKVALEAYDHQDVPFEELIQALQPVRDLSHTPLVQVMLILDQAIPTTEMKFHDLTWSVISVENFTSKLDLTLTLENTPQGLVGLWEYNTDLFDASTIERMTGHFQTLLTEIVANPNQHLLEIDILTESEKNQLLENFNNNTRNYPVTETIHRLFEEQVKQTPNKIALESQEIQLTYQNINEKANKIARFLQNLGVKEGEFVGILMQRKAAFLVAILAILKAGGVYVPLDPSYPQERIKYMLVNSKIKILFSEYYCLEKFPDLFQDCCELKEIICLNSESIQRNYVTLPEDIHLREESEFEHFSKENLDIEIQGIDPAYMIYTSGSTGLPKGAIIRHGGAINHIYAQYEALELTEDLRFLQSAPVSSDISIWQFLAPVLIGGKTVIVDTVTVCDPEKLFSVIQKARITIVELVPVVFGGLINYLEKLSSEQRALPHLKWMMVTGETVSVDSVNRWLNLHSSISVINAYGPSEASDDITQYIIDKPLLENQRTLPIGKPLANLNIYILSEKTQLVPIGVPGEICVSGYGVGLGYWQNELLTRLNFIPNPFSTTAKPLPGTDGDILYKTGDLGRWLPDGSIEFLGRIDHQVKLRGFRIELGEIEAVLSQAPNVRETVVIDREDTPGQKRLVAYIVAQQALSISQLRGFLKEKLPEYMIPSAFVMLEAMPLTPSGKVDRHALPVPEMLLSEREESFVAPQTPTEEMLALIWADVLEVEHVGINDNFFELGGHSLLATQLLSRVRTAFNLELPLRTLFEAATIADFAECIQQLQHDRPKLLALPLQAIATDENLPLSFAQQRLWFLEQLEPDNTAYNIPGAVSLSGQLQVSALEQSLREIIRRHRILHTNFITLDGQPVQIIQPADSWALSILDWQDIRENEQEIATQQLITQEAHRPFDLAKESLIRMSLLVLSQTEHILVFCMHHIVSDAWSMGVFIQELATLYRAFAQGQPSPLPELAIQYADFAVWQRQWLQADVLESQLSYWQKQLADAPALLELPTDRPRPAVQTFRGANQSFVLSSELTQALNLLSRRQGVTLFMTLLTAYNILLYRYTAQNDIVVGSPIANRNRSEIEGLIGFFVNTLVLRTDVSGNPSFEELLRRVREMTMDAYAHQDLPFELLVEALQPERGLSYTPLFQVAFVLQNAPVPEIELPGLILNPLTVDTTTAKFDLILTFENTGQELVGLWEYNTDLFEASTIERITGHLQTLLAAIVVNPQQRLAELPILTAFEQHQLLVEWNDTLTSFPQDKCIHQLFEQQVTQTPDAMAVIFEDQQLTYQELNCRANQLAHYLLNLGVGANVLVGLCVERSLEMIVGLLGILKAGGAYVPLDPTYPLERLSFILEDVQSPVLLTQEHLLDALPSYWAQVICLDSDWDEITQLSQENLNNSVLPSSLAYVMYTSGSTGTPKGVAVPHQAINRLVLNTNYIQLEPEDRVAQAAKAVFDAATFEIWGALLHGAKLVGITHDVVLSPQEFATQLSREQISVLFLTTALFNQLVSLVPHTFNSLKYLLFGGEAVDPGTVKQVLENGGPQQLLHVYGPTESTTFTSWYCVKNVSATATTIPIGRPLSNTQIYLLDQNLKPVPIGVPGELYIGGAGLARGYLNRPELTTEKFIPNPFSDDPHARLYKTGDLARYLPDGNIEYLERIDQQVKIRGFRIELGEVEAIVCQHANVLSAVVIVREDTPGNKRLVAYLVPDSQQPPTIDELRQFLHTKLPEYMIPTAFVMLETLPLTPNGKVDRRSLPAPDSRSQLEVSFVAPRNSTEQILADIWADVLGVKEVGIHDNFFQLGGDSILGLQIIVRANQAKLQVSLKQLFANQSIANLAIVAGTTERIQAEQGLVTGALPLTPIQHWFFEQNLPEPHHFNQSVVLEVPKDVKADILEQVLQQLLKHHDALRLRFTHSDSGWEQINAAFEETVLLSIVDLSGISLEKRPAAFEATGNRLQASLNLSAEPLLRAALFDYGVNQSNRLLLIIHHLAVDGVSWRILLEDLHTAYQQLSRGIAMQLPSKTSSFKDWALKLTQYGHSEPPKAEFEYWLTEVGTDITLLPVDYPLDQQTNTRATTACVSVSLSAELTNILLQEVPSAYNTQINDVLLTVLVQSFAQWTGQYSLLVDLEGHGREEVFEDIDLSRTVGWFTSVFPIRLQLDKQNHPGDALKSIKEQLRRLPKRGIGYGILRYLSQNAEQLRALPQAQVSFNYLGQFAQEFSASAAMWKFVQESGGADNSPLQHRNYLLELNALVINGKLQLNWTYNQNFHQQSTIERLAQWFMAALQTLINHCQSPDTGGYTPSDFPEAELSQKELEDIMSAFNVF
jgi:amino acid adenylation domain-containing protein/non-ribosomal peptide synthase protein (TIGR01720 family)